VSCQFGGVDLRIFSLIEDGIQEKYTKTDQNKHKKK